MTRSWTGRAAAGAAVLWSIAGAAGQPCQSWVLRDPGDGPSKRATVAPMAWDSARQDLVLFGGQYYIGPGSGYQFFNDLWAWDGTAWNEIAVPGTRPSLRSSYGIAFDRGRDRLVVFGGYVVAAPHTSGETWEFDRGTGAWTLASSSGPSARYEPALVYDEARGQCVMFGGGTGTSLAANDTWTWNGDAWTRRTTTPAPPARLRPGMVYDSHRQVTLLYGGTGVGGPLTDTWEWDGTNWTQRPASPPTGVGFYNALGYDRARRVVVLHGGNLAGSGATIWEWDGVAWTSRPLAGPADRYAHAMGFDEVRLEIVIFGGLKVNGGGGPTGNFNDTWGYIGNDLRFTQSPQGQVVESGLPAQFHAEAASGTAFTYRWRRNGGEISDGPAPGGGVISGSGTDTLAITPARRLDAGIYDVVARNSCGPVISAPAGLGITCYADCDLSTGPGMLDIFDFLCFQNRFAALEPYACDCDTGTGTGVCDIFDFLCFQNALAGGCR